MIMLANITIQASICSDLSHSHSSEVIDLSVSKNDPDKGKNDQHKSPVQIPSVSLDDHTLYFFTPCDGCVLNLVDESGVVVYSLVIPEDTAYLELPAELSGEYELQIVRGNYCFWGVIEL